MLTLTLNFDALEIAYAVTRIAEDQKSIIRKNFPEFFSDHWFFCGQINGFFSCQNVIIINFDLGAFIF